MDRLTRRALLTGAAASFAAPALAQTRAARLFAYVGCYTTPERYARGDGIHVYRVDAGGSGWVPVERVGELVNPSFLAMRRDGRFLYAAHGDESYASAFAVEPASGRLTPLNRAASGGRNGVHLALDPAGRFLIVANYSSGSVGVLPVAADGRLSDAVHVAALPGQPGPHRVEQASSHPHQILFDPSGRFVVVPDKGLDRVFVFTFDRETGKLTPTVQGSAVARSGSGPRHGVFHPRLTVLWVLNEIGSTVTTYQWEAERGHLRPAQILSSLPADYTGENTAAEIALSRDARFLYCSNRGHDSIATFAVDPATGLLSAMAWTSSQGRTPRFITLDPAGRMLYAANEQSDTIVPFRVDEGSGRLTPAGAAVSNASPVTIVFADSNG
ncbi:MAG: lactonase family protein [Acidobacteria bacterium]|nr:lactonase family protein [Acidobacteriota bacterium]